MRARGHKLARETRAAPSCSCAPTPSCSRRCRARCRPILPSSRPTRCGPCTAFASPTTWPITGWCAPALAALPRGHEALAAEHYPEPVDHCAVCVWEARCAARRRADDHLSFVAGAARAHRQELTAQGYPTLTAAAAMPVPVAFRPARGARETYDRIGHQARAQHQQRVAGRPVVERLPVGQAEGLTRLPEPSPGDLFLDLEGRASRAKAAASSCSASGSRPGWPVRTPAARVSAARAGARRAATTRGGRPPMPRSGRRSRR